MPKILLNYEEITFVGNIEDKVREVESYPVHGIYLIKHHQPLKSNYGGDIAIVTEGGVDFLYSNTTKKLCTIKEGYPLPMIFNPSEYQAPITNEKELRDRPREIIKEVQVGCGFTPEQIIELVLVSRSKIVEIQR